ncbi:MAG: 50S ribosomal protein L9 [Bacillota bacterium]
MRVILLKDVVSLGKAGDLVTVAEGYARNYLIPRLLAEPASEKKLAELGRIRQQREKKAVVMANRAEQTASRLRGQTVSIPVKVGGGGRLFGAVTAKDIAAVLERALEIKLDKKQIVLEAPLKETGSYNITARIAPGITAEFKVAVVPEQEG